MYQAWANVLECIYLIMYVMIYKQRHAGCIPEYKARLRSSFLSGAYLVPVSSWVNKIKKITGNKTPERDGENPGQKNLIVPVRSPHPNPKKFVLLLSRVTCHASAPNMAKAKVTMYNNINPTITTEPAPLCQLQELNPDYIIP